MRSETNLNDGWTFAEGFDPAWTGAPMAGTTVRLPHNATDLPLAYLDERAFQRPFTYQRAVTAPAEGMNHLRVDAAMADARVWVNGAEVLHHPDGYTPFRVPLPPGENLVTIRVDGSENPEIPPFGGRIDYLTYAGIYRDAWLVTHPERHIRSVKVETPAPLGTTVRVLVDADGPVEAVIRDTQGAEIARETGEGEITFTGFTGLRLWDINDPVLYTVETRLGEDTLTTRFGVRSAEFRPDGFYLNNRPLKLRGLNRHQSFAHSGYAQGRRAQERDAEILRHDLGCNIVRTSHYPQSPWFLHRCDEIGLMVFEEIPGWQHIGGPLWQDRSVDNARAMITRDWNHPSIVIWGVRINESQDAHDFYTRTNALARELDPTRPTGGVRYITDSELLEDVYTMNDFVLGEFELPGSNRPRMGLRSPAEVTGLKTPVPYLVTEYNGHMFPTKAGDPEQRQHEHVLRHLDVLDAAMGDPGISGCIGWCMFDYNTHNDFGAGDRICHHGVMTIWREPKFAAYAYASQKPPSEGVVMEPVTVWARGERNIGGVLPLIVLTNCDEVELAYADMVKRVGPDRARFPNLDHPPVIIDHRHFTADELGSWGQSWHAGTVRGFLNGQEVARRDFPAGALPTRLEVAPDGETVETGEEMRVMFRALDQAGNKLMFLPETVTITLDGPATLIGPAMRVLQGGTTGCYLRATAPGTIRLTAACAGFAPETITLTAT